MMADLLSLVHVVLVMIVAGIFRTVWMWIREDARTRRVKIASEGTESEHKAAAIEAAVRPWWRQPF